MNSAATRSADSAPFNSIPEVVSAEVFISRQSWRSRWCTLGTHTTAITSPKKPNNLRSIMDLGSLLLERGAVGRYVSRHCARPRTRLARACHQRSRKAGLLASL
jgi:hypothetical protein